MMTTNIHGVVKIEIGCLEPLTDCQVRKVKFTCEDGITFEVSAFGKPEGLAISF